MSEFEQSSQSGNNMPKPEVSSEEESQRIRALAFEQAKQEAAFALPRQELDQELDLDKVPEVFKDSLFVEQLKNQKIKGSQTVLITDVDRTFWLKDQPELSDQLAEVLKQTDIPLIYCSGRGVDGLQSDLPPADVIIAAVGTEIYVRDKEGILKKDESFTEELHARGWDCLFCHQVISDFIANKDELQWQSGYEVAEPSQRPVQSTKQEFKMSLLFSPSENLSLEQFSEDIEKLLPPWAGAVISINYHAENSYNVDILPKAEGVVGKALPILYLKIFFPVHTIVAGDSGNDISMMTESDSDAILVGNALTDAQDKIQSITALKEEAQIKFYQGAQNKHAIYLGSPGQEGPKAIASALGRGDFNPQLAPFVKISSMKTNLER